MSLSDERLMAILREVDHGLPADASSLTSLADAGLDSLAVFEFFARVDAEVGQWPDELSMPLETIGDLFLLAATAVNR